MARPPAITINLRDRYSGTNRKRNDLISITIENIPWPCRSPAIDLNAGLTEKPGEVVGTGNVIPGLVAEPTDPLPL